MTVEEIIKTPEYISVVDDYKDVCLWFSPECYHPHTGVQLEQILTSIERNGDLNAYKRVGRIRKWLSPNFKPTYSSGLPIHG
jgi:hypothetical protein